MIERQAFGIEPDVPLVVWAGRMDPIKDLATFVEVIALLRKRGKITAVLLGDGPERPHIEAFIHHCGLESVIRMALWSDNVAGWLKAADVLLFPSLTEGSPNVVIEAMLCGCPVVAGKQGGDAAAVAFDAAKAAIQRRIDILLIDTAGRQHTRRGLMDELTKIRRTLAKACPGAPHEVWLTIDGSSGSNALVQAREFGKLCEVTGLILTKLDGTGKGGVVVAIHQELGYPVCFVGLGEQMTDLQPFDSDLFARALFE